MKKGFLLFVLTFSIFGLLFFLFKGKLYSLFMPKGAKAASPGAENTQVVYVPSPGKQNQNDAPEVDYWSLNTTRMLKRGISGNEVIQLQQMINEALKLKKLPPLVVDGSFGSKTEGALKKLTGKIQITLAEASTMLIKAVTKL